MEQPSLTVGIEEEYFLVDLESRDLADNPPEELMQCCIEKLSDQVSPEFMRSQIEVGTRPHRTVRDAVDELAEMRSTIAEIASKFDLAPIAASTHPFGNYRQQMPTSRQRYEELAVDLGTPVRRLQICGCHVHAEIANEDLRIDLMNQVSYFLPHILAMTTSSPYWEGEDTGMQSYRLCVFDALPRTGLPEIFESAAEYQRLVTQMVNAGCIEDATKIWWDIRPSDRYPTLEMRVADVCTNLRDCGAIAALYQALLSSLYRLRMRNQRWRLYPRLMLQENRWRAMRYGVNGDLVDLGKGKTVAFSELIDELVDIVAEDADRLGTSKDMQHLKSIVKNGTSSDRQRKAFDKATAAGKSKDEALMEVVDHLVSETTKQPYAKGEQN